jgi:hypothetical protein
MPANLDGETPGAMAEDTDKSNEIAPPPGGPAQREFMGGLSLRKTALPPACLFTLLGLAIGKGATPLEVRAAQSSGGPNRPQVRAVWKTRQGGRAAPLILAVLHDGKATLCGPSGDEPATYSGVERGQAERICRKALAVADRENIFTPGHRNSSPHISCFLVRSADFQSAFSVIATAKPTASRRSELLAFRAECEISGPATLSHYYEPSNSV